MGKMTLRFKKIITPPTGGITVTSVIQSECSTKIVLSVDPQGDIDYTSFTTTGNFASITPAPGPISVVTNYTITLAGYSVVFDGDFDVDYTEFVFELRDNFGGTILDSYGNDRYHTGRECGDIVIDPIDDEIPCLDCDFDDNGGFGFGWQGLEP